ncbi:MAG: HlyD family type I secretion periplasmic adaptor subunit [Pseudomonadota bacterium]
MTENDLMPPAILKTGTRVPILSGMIIFAFLFLGLGTWLLTAELSGAVIASGTVTVLGKAKTIQHLDGGIVSQILVGNGDLVKRDEVLLRLEDTVLLSNLEIYQSRLQAAIATRDRLQAEQNNDVGITPIDAELRALELEPNPIIRRGQQLLFEARLSRVNGQVAQLEEKVEQFRRQTFGLQSSVSAKGEQLQLFEKEFDNLSRLADSGYAAENRVFGLARDIAALKGQIAGDQADLARIDNLVTETRIQMSQVKREFYEAVVTELRVVEQEINDLIQQVTATRDQLARVELKSPISGIVHQMSIFTEGGVINAGAPILQIVPDTARMEFEVNVAPVSIDQVFIGQSAKITFSAFNTRTTPQLEGIVRHISPDSIINPDTGAGFYRVRLSVTKSEVERLGNVELLPGMPIEVFLTTESRTPMNYLLRPLVDNLKRAMREE